MSEQPTTNSGLNKFAFMHGFCKEKLQTQAAHERSILRFKRKMVIFAADNEGYAFFLSINIQKE